MKEKDKIPPPSANDPDALVARYGHLLDPEVRVPQQPIVLAALCLIMQGFVDLGLDVEVGKKLHKNSDIGMDDVLYYICREETAPETVAPPESRNGKEPI
ncbi:hypothetical protein ACOTTU_16980 [Roseobacter sp. EG26]|uniref:hypothetical protein n=1 Tax=Roseobacter sp. EG26 TaxID=3412477 RepID=UPI003CE593FD